MCERTCVCVCDDKLRDAERTLRERRAGGADVSSRWRRHGVRVRVSLRRPDGCRRVLRRTRLRCDWAAGVRQAGGDASEPRSRCSQSKLRRRFTLMNSSLLPDTILMKMFLMHEVIYECDRAGVIIEFSIHSFTTQTNKYTP